MKTFFLRFVYVIKHDSDNKRFIGAVACIVVALAAVFIGPVPGTEGDAITVGLVIAGLGGAFLILLAQGIVSFLRHAQAKRLYYW